MELSSTCFKIDKVNAVAMILGFRQYGAIRHTAIWVDVRDRHDHCLISYNRSPTHFTPSAVGLRLDADHCRLPLKYVAIWNRQYPIKNDMRLWATLCSNGLFDIWEPEAPFNRLAQAKADPRRYRIHLFRVFELDRAYGDSDIHPVSTRIDHLVAVDRHREVIHPVVPDEEFREITALLDSSVRPYVIGDVLQNSTQPQSCIGADNRRAIEPEPQRSYWPSDSIAT